MFYLFGIVLCNLSFWRVYGINHEYKDSFFAFKQEKGQLRKSKEKTPSIVFWMQEESKPREQVTIRLDKTILMHAHNLVHNPVWGP